MKRLDRVLQEWRIRTAAAYIKAGDRVLDIGCADGALFRLVPGLGESVGVEPDVDGQLKPLPNVQFYSGYFPSALPHPMSFDVITMLAVLEHVPRTEQGPLAQACASHLVSGGRLIITVPSPAVDYVLAVLQFLRLIDGMSLQQHYGFEPQQTPGLFSQHGLTLIAARGFQLGFNHLFVFQRK